MWASQKCRHICGSVHITDLVLSELNKTELNSSKNGTNPTMVSYPQTNDGREREFIIQVSMAGYQTRLSPIMLVTLDIHVNINKNAKKNKQTNAQ